MPLAKWSLVLFLLLPLAPARATDTWTTPYPGVRLLARTTTEPNHIFATYIDLCSPGISVHGTLSDDRGMRTSAFATAYGLQVAINAGFYGSNFAPIGFTMGDGDFWTDSSDSTTTGFAAFGTDNGAYISPPAETYGAPEGWMDDIVGGFPLLVDNGAAVSIPCESHWCERHPRTAIGLTDEGYTALLVVVDGRWTGVSRGMTLAELAALMVDLGAERALNLDGGGSTTMVVAAAGGVVNHPSDAAGERTVSNHLGFTAGGPTDFAHCCRPAPVAGATGTFADLPAGHWALDAAETLYALGVTNGCSASPRLFCPDCDVTREHAAVLACRALGLPPLDPATPTFGDVPRGSFGYGYIEALYAAGYVTGCSTSPRLYCPAAYMTRAEAAVLFTRLLGADPLPTNPPTFTDTPADAWYTPYVERLYASCIVNGCSASGPQFCPDGDVTRAAFAIMLVRTLELGAFTNCYEPTCTPDCTNAECGDDGCGGSCGSCAPGEACTGGLCLPAADCVVDDAEPDESGGEPALTPGVALYRSICPAGDVDYAAFSLAVADDIVLETSGGGGGDTLLMLLDGAGRELAADDDSGPDLFSRIEMAALPAGDYLVRVSEYGDDDAIASYAITLTTSGGCTPDCTGRECGTDGCGGSCGPCPPGESCNAAGQCAVVCTPACTGRECGPDNCGGSCGSCAPGESCSATGRCEAGCIPACGQRVCGDDLCGGSCGTCEAGLVCNALGQCVQECVPLCTGRECGDDGCGSLCGTCAAGESCQAGRCEPGACVPDCTGRECGDDGCGNLCGSCAAGETCTAGHCEPNACVPQCNARECGPDGCGAVCGVCAPGTACNAAGQCTTVCEGDCTGRACGDDGCGGSCGTCPAGESCDAVGQCVPLCPGDCTGRACGDDGCGGSCGTCPAGQFCAEGGQCQTGPCEGDCAGRACGDDGCGGSCGSCPAGEVCDAAGQCQSGPCEADCAGRACGDDGCGGSCGSCPAGETCTDGLCVSASADTESPGGPDVFVPGGPDAGSADAGYVELPGGGSTGSGCAAGGGDGLPAGLALLLFGLGIGRGARTPRRRVG